MAAKKIMTGSHEFQTLFEPHATFPLHSSLKTKGKNIQFTTIGNTDNTEKHFGRLASETYLT